MTRSFLFLLTALCWVCPTVPGAGALFTDRELGSAQLVAQRALITFADGRQRLVIESAYTGSATNLGWVIPLPSRPAVEEVSADLFPTLTHLFQPQVIMRVRPWWLYLAALGLVVGLVRLLYLRSRFGTALVVLTALLSILVLWLPNQSPAHASHLTPGPRSDATRALAKPEAGAFEITVLEPPAERALQEWLASNGFHASTAAFELFADYANRGWVFVALKAQSLADTNGQSLLPPISLTFESPQPFYPLRFTALNERPVHLDLYVLGIGRAGASGFQTRRCSPIRTNQISREWGVARANGSLILRHPELRDFVVNAPFGTWLRRILEPAQLRQDVQIEWIDRERSGERLYTHAAALQFAVNVAAFSLVGCLLILIGLRHRLPRGHSLNPTLSRLLFAVTGIALLTYLMIPKPSNQEWTLQWHVFDGAPTHESSPFPGPEPSDSPKPTADSSPHPRALLQHRLLRRAALE